MGRAEEIDTLLHSVRDGRREFTDFWLATRRDWGALARKLHRPWLVPPAVDVSDIEQELLMEAWLRIPLWNPLRGPTLRAFVVFGAISVALRMINEQRGALRRSSRAPSRTPVCFAMLPEVSGHKGAGKEALESRLEALRDKGLVEPDQDVFSDYSMQMRCIEKGLDARERWCLRLMLEGGCSTKHAAPVLLARDPNLRTLRSARKVLYSVRDHARRVSATFTPSLGGC